MTRQRSQKHLQRQFGQEGEQEPVREGNVIPGNPGHSVEAGRLNPAGP